MTSALPRWPGAVAALAVALLALGPLAVLVWRAGGAGGIGVADLAALRFTLVQAALSAALSLALAVPVARALARRRFRGRGVVIALLGAPFILPVIVAVVGLLAIFGRGGVLNDALALVGLPRLSIYGLHGVVLAHVFFNLPLAVRMILTGWQAIPEDRFRLAASLGAPVFRTLEWPMLRTVLPGAALVIFLVCLTSFAVALTLGGGPGATTLELAIFQALRFDFAPDRAAALALMQLAICAVAAAVAGLVAQPPAFGRDPGRVVPRWDGRGPGDGIAILGWARCRCSWPCRWPP
jgi:thiamine transport system permease protein